MEYLKTALFKALIKQIQGINPDWVSNRVKYPKIALHSWIENQPQDKAQKVREISFIVEGYSNSSYEEAVEMANQVAESFCNTPPEIPGAQVVSIYPDGTEEATEENDNNLVYYRQLNRLIATIKKN